MGDPLMGMGDWVMATATVKKAFARTGKPVCVGNGNRAEWNEVFEGNPKIARAPYPGCAWVDDYKGHRPYVDYAKSNAEHTEYRKSFRVEPGEIYLSDAEKSKYAMFAGCVYIEPNVKGSYGRNKDWGFDRWQAVADRLSRFRILQGRGRRLRGVEQVDTDSFRDALRLLHHADLFIGTDGGLHHAAAAFGKRAVVVWGGLVGPQILGYRSHVNLCAARTFCGSHAPCLHCKSAMDAIQPQQVQDAALGILNERAAA